VVTKAEDRLTFINSTDGVRVAVHDLGGPTDPTTTVLLFSHATGLHGRVWEEMASHLNDRYRCLALDYRGHGCSTMPEGTNLAWSQMGDDAVAVLTSDLIGPHQVVHGVGHSMGGAALVLASARLKNQLRSLWLYEPVIVPPGALPNADAPNPMADGAARRRASFASYEDAITNYASKPPLNELVPAALHSYVMGGFKRQGDGTVTLRCLPTTEAAVFRGAIDSGAWDLWPDLDGPAAVIAGREESFGPVAFVPSIMSARRDTMLIERRHLGHFGPLEDPKAMAKDLEEWVLAHP
jgi:pimeloyl-ACP methyl ester carboxylesterase